MSEYLSQEVEAFKKLKEAGFSEEQIDAINEFIDFKLSWVHKYRDETREKELTKIRLELREHGHLNGKVVQRY